jgi:hypothetical protein
MVMNKKYTIDIKDILNSLDMRDIQWYDNLSDDEKHKISNWQIMRFMSACQTNNKEIEFHYLTLTNDIVNVNFNLLKKYPDLQYKLLQIVGIGKKQYHPWIPPSKREKDSKLISWLCDRFPTYSYDEILDLLLINKKEDIILFLQDNGLSDEEINEFIR